MAQRGEPVLSAPATGVGRVNRDDRESGVEGHLREPVPEPPGRDACDRPSEPAPGRSSAWPPPGALASFGAGLGEI